MVKITENRFQLYELIKVKSQKSRVKSQKSRVKSQESRVKSQKSRVKSQKSRVKSQKSRVKSQKSKVKSQESIRVLRFGIKRILMQEFYRQHSRYPVPTFRRRGWKGGFITK